MRIIRTVLFLCGVTAFLPSPPEDAATSNRGEGVAAVPDQGLLATAAVAIADVASLCSRQPDVCQTAGYVAGKLEAKAKYSVKLLYEWANEPDASASPAPASEMTVTSDPLTTGSTQAVAEAEGQGQSTLRLEDLIPEWRGPPPRKSG